MSTRSSRVWVMLSCLGLAVPAWGYAMTSEELTSALKKAGAAEAALLEEFPADIEEKRPDFLAGAAYLRVSALDPHHPHLLHFVVAPAGSVYRLKVGKPELERMRTELKLEIRDEDQALRYAQWVLEVTEGPALWLLSSVDDVPFQPVVDGEAELAKRIASAKTELARKISKPSARATKDGFAITQEAIQGMDLVRFDVVVSARGGVDVKKRTVASELPVVYVLGD